jgi:DNA-binding response OmpR family regulator
MHGNISVESEENKGSTFYVEIPLGKEHLRDSEFILLDDMPETASKMTSEKSELTDAEEVIISKVENPILLIVEDNSDVRMHMTDNFRQDYIIYQAVDGISGLKKATEIIPDLIITDLMMPGMDGLELCAKLKGDQRTSHIPVIMLTAKVSRADKITGLQTGADDYIAKPFNMAELKVRASNLIDQRKRLRERFSREITLEPGEISITPLDEKFLTRAIELVENHIKDEEFDLTVLINELNMSRSTLFRKLQALTDQSPTEFIRTIRLKRAASLLRQNYGNVTQVAMEAGFNNLSYFNRTFKKYFGVSPLEYSKSDEHAS